MELNTVFVRNIETAKAPLFLARLMLLALSQIGDAGVAQGLIAAATQDLPKAA